MRLRLSFILVFGLGLLLGACAPRELSPREYLQWANDPGSGLSQSKALGAYTFRLQTLPPEWMALNSYGPQAAQDPLWSQWLDQYREVRYFNFRIELSQGQGTVLKQGVASQAAYDERLKHFAFDMQQQLYLLQGGDTLACVLHHFERSYQLAPHATFMLAFEPGDIGASSTFVYEDSQLGTGPVRFQLAAQQSLSLPKIALK